MKAVLRVATLVALAPAVLAVHPWSAAGSLVAPAYSAVVTAAESLRSTSTTGWPEALVVFPQPREGASNPAKEGGGVLVQATEPATDNANDEAERADVDPSPPLAQALDLPGAYDVRAQAAEPMEDFTQLQNTYVGKRIESGPGANSDSATEGGARGADDEGARADVDLSLPSAFELELESSQLTHAATSRAVNAEEMESLDAAVALLSDASEAIVDDLTFSASVPPGSALTARVTWDITLMSGSAGDVDSAVATVGKVKQQQHVAATSSEQQRAHVEGGIQAAVISARSWHDVFPRGATKQYHTQLPPRSAGYFYEEEVQNISWSWSQSQTLLDCNNLLFTLTVVVLILTALALLVAADRLEKEADALDKDAKTSAQPDIAQMKH